MATIQVIAKLEHYQLIPFYCKWKGGGVFDFIVLEGEKVQTVKEKLVELESVDLNTWTEKYRKPGYVTSVTKPNKTDLEAKKNAKEGKK